MTNALKLKTPLDQNCPRCKGDGELHGGWDGNSQPMVVSCSRCYGTGVAGMNFVELELRAKACREGVTA